MSRKIRTILITLFTIYFLIVGSIITLKINGYNLSFQDGLKISHSATISLDTYPNKSLVYLNGEVVGQTNTMLNLNDGQKFDVKIVKEGYLEQEYNFSAPENSNSFLKIEKNLLLPTDYQTIKFSNNGDLNYEYLKILQFLTDNKILVYDNKDLYIFYFYQNSNNLNIQKLVLNSNNLLIDDKELNNLKEGDGVFYNEKYVIFENNQLNSWEIKALPKNSQRAVLKDKNGNSNIIYLDQNENAWMFNLKTGISTLFDSGVQFLKSDGDRLWFVKNNEIFRANGSNTYLDGEKIYTINLNQNHKQGCSEIQIQKVFKGEVFLCDQKLFLLENNKSIFLGDARVFVIFENLIFWQDYANKLFFFNLNNYTKNYIQYLQLDAIKKLQYNQEYQSLFAFKDDGIWELKFRDYWQNSILNQVEPKLWQNKTCLIKQMSRAIYCIGKEGLDLYYNQEIIF